MWKCAKLFLFFIFLQQLSRVVATPRCMIDPTLLFPPTRWNHWSWIIRMLVICRILWDTRAVSAFTLRIFFIYPIFLPNIKEFIRLNLFHWVTFFLLSTMIFFSTMIKFFLKQWLHFFRNNDSFNNISSSIGGISALFQNLPPAPLWDEMFEYVKWSFLYMLVVLVV